jgi:hypothetical protein
VVAVLSGCGRSAPPPQWTTAFWFWQGSSNSVQTAAPVDAIYAHAGTISRMPFLGFGRQWAVHMGLPERLPRAGEYWAVFRYDYQDVPALSIAADLTQRFAELQRQSRRQKLQFTGIQLDIDSPTRSLWEYAIFLKAVRKGMPPATRISITCLLDWFRSGTAIDGVIEQVDEFVPQFYDVAPGYKGNYAIATRVSAGRWGSVFNRYRKPFRIGIAAFGRVRLLRADGPPYTINGLSPIDAAANPAFALRTSRTEAEELVLNYDAISHTQIAYMSIKRGETVQFVLPTPEAVDSAVRSARQMGPWCGGVAFFRWPAFNETLALAPDEVLAAARGEPHQRNPVALETVDGSCAAVHCTDLYMGNLNPLSPKPVRYRVLSSTELEYFVPNEKMPIRMTSLSRIELPLPPYSGRDRMYLGRAVTAGRARFTLEPHP